MGKYLQEVPETIHKVPREEDKKKWGRERASRLT
jgi:hypothetical protein